VQECLHEWEWGVYIDDILILAESKEMARDHVMGLLYLLENLSFVISKPKCVLDPMQIIEFLGFSVNSVQQELSLPLDAEPSYFLQNQSEKWDNTHWCPG